MVDGQAVLAVAQRVEAAPGVAREALEERAVVLRQRRAVDDELGRPACEARVDQRARDALSADRRLPGALSRRETCRRQERGRLGRAGADGGGSGSAARSGRAPSLRAQARSPRGLQGPEPE